MRIDSPGRMLRQLVAQRTIAIPGVPHALAARLAQQQGLRAIYLSGATFSAAALAMPDIGLFTLTELVQQATWITRRCQLPLVVDADTGFGEAVQVERTIVELEEAGVAAIQLEDQQLPKRCGHLSGKTLVDAEVMCSKLRAAVDARRDPQLVIIARTDARASEGMAGALERAQRYLDAGADWVFPEALENPEEFAQFAQQIKAPLVANMTEFGKSPLLTVEQLQQLGYAAVLFPVSLLRVSMKAMEGALRLIAERGSQQPLLEQMQTRQQLYELLDYHAYEQRDQAYFGRSQ